jgi:hypothetical protein
VARSPASSSWTTSLRAASSCSARRTCWCWATCARAGARPSPAAPSPWARRRASCRRAVSSAARWPAAAAGPRPCPARRRRVRPRCSAACSRARWPGQQPVPVLHGPLADLRGRPQRGRLVIERLDELSERVDLEVAGKGLVHGLFFDLARAGIELTPGATYTASLGVADPRIRHRPRRQARGHAGGRPPAALRLQARARPMARARFRRDALAVAGIALLAGLLCSSPAVDVVRGLSLDALTALRWQAFGPRHDAAASPVVVIAIDEESYQTAPFQGSPTITWTGEIGHAADGRWSRPRWPWSASTWSSRVRSRPRRSPSATSRWAARLRGFDRSFLRALHGAAASGQVVLGEVLHRRAADPAGGRAAGRGGPAAQPARAQRACRRRRRGAPPAAELLARRPAGAGDGCRAGRSRAARGTGLRQRRFADAGRAPLRLAAAKHADLDFDGGADDIPTYSLADLSACARQGQRDFFRHQFAGKVVLLGTLLDSEDRQLTSKRFATGPERAAAPRCALAAAGGRRPRPCRAAHGRRRLRARHGRRQPAAPPGRHRLLGARGRCGRRGRPGGRWPAAAALLARALPPPRWPRLGSAAVYTAGCWCTAGIPRTSLALPLLGPFIAGLLAMAAATGADHRLARRRRPTRDRRLLRRSFGLYLSPRVIDRMMLQADRPPAARRRAAPGDGVLLRHRRASPASPRR